MKNFRIPFDWRMYFDLEVAAVYLGFVVLQLVLSIIPVGRLVDGLPDKLGRLKYRCNGKIFMRCFFMATYCCAVFFSSFYFLKKFWRV